jgi:predicted N-acyltransferase
MTNLAVETLRSIHEVEAGAWNEMVGPDDFYQSHEWLAAVERDRSATPRYLVAFAGGQPVGALPVYQVAREGTAAYQPARFRDLLDVRGDYHVAGTRRCYRSDFTLAQRLPADIRDQVAGALVRAALAQADENGMAGLGLFYLPTAALRRIGRVVPVTAAFDSAETVISGIGDGIDAYLGRLSSRRRGKMRREIRTFAATGWRTDVTRLGDCVAEVAALVSRVEQRHGHGTPDALLRRVFRWQVQAADSRAVVFACRDGAGELVACTVNYAWRDTLYSRAFGVDYARTKGSFAYFNLVIYQAIEYAAAHGLNRLHLGLASLAKVERGAVASPLWTAAVRTGTLDRPPGIRLVDPAAMRRWSEPYACYSHALPAQAWTLPEGCQACLSEGPGCFTGKRSSGTSTRCGQHSASR